MTAKRNDAAVVLVSNWLVLSPCVRSSSGARVTLTGPKCWHLAQWHCTQTLGRNMDCYTERTNKRYFLQTHVLKKTLLLRTSEAGGWQVMGNGRSIYFDNTQEKKSHTDSHTTHLKGFSEHQSFCFLVLLHGARVKPGKEHFNPMFYLDSCYFFDLVRCADLTFLFLSDTFRLWTCLFVHNSLFWCVSSFTCPLLNNWCKYLNTEGKKNKKNKLKSFKKLMAHILANYGADLD